MNIIEQAPVLRARLQEMRQGKRVALVPTMGCLHAGHLSLIEQVRAAADIVVASIYVNPLQFGPNEDLERYPRTFDADARACREAGVDLLFHPATLYPEQGPAVTLTTSGLTDCLCGAARPGHFDGVVTVVNILFNIVRPDIAIFGEKDWQQLAVIRRMVADLQMPIEILGGTIVREPDGLAMSSRNRYLNSAERRRAVALSQAMQAMRQAAERGERDAGALKQIGAAILDDAGTETEYLEIRCAATLEPVERLDARPARAFIAARIGGTRLIDNISLDHTALEPISPAISPEETR